MKILIRTTGSSCRALSLYPQLLSIDSSISLIMICFEDKYKGQ